MKKLIIGIAVLILSACGSNSSAPPSTACLNTFEGTWTMTEGSNVAVATFNADCSASLQGSGTLASQNALFTFDRPLNGAFLIHVSSTTGGYSFPPSNGTYSCAFTQSATQLVIDCGDGGHVYSR